jgi:hypothetical protein
MRLFFKLAMGDPFLFLPATYRKGSAQREPADLVWAANGCVVLAYLCRMTNAARAERHNLTQARGWLRGWRTLGVPLEGENDHTRFNIRHGSEDFTHTVVLSIIEAPDAYARFDLTELSGLGVTLSATLPLSVVARFARMHASIPDVCRFVDLLRSEHPGPVGEADVLASVDAYHEAAWRTSGADAAWRDDETDPTEIADRRFLDGFLHTISTLPLRQLAGRADAGGTPRSDSTAASSHVEASIPAARLFADLDLRQTLWLALRIKGGMDRRRQRVADRSRPPNTAPLILEHVPLDHYDLTLCAVSADGGRPRVDKALAQLDRFARDHDRTGTGRVGPILTLLVGQDPSRSGVMGLVGSLPSLTALQLMLDRVRAGQAAGP